MRTGILLLFAAMLMLALYPSCSSSPTDSDNGNGTTPPPSPPPATTYTLSTSADPSDGGSVSPSSGTYEEDTDVSIEATPASGFAFREWDGDAGGSDNPVTVTMNSDKSVTALFDDLRSQYSAELTFADSTDQLVLEFGQSESPADSLQQAPPAPPEGAMHAWFASGEDELFADYRDMLDDQAEWELHFQPGEQPDVTLSWSLEITRMEGTLTLTSEVLDDDIDMTETDTIDFTATEGVVFTIVYEK